MNVLGFSFVGPLLVVAAAFWVAGLRLFVRADMTRRWKLGWCGFLVLIGVAIGVVLPLGQLWRKFLLIMVLLPVIAVADVYLLRTRRGLSYWIRACGFEVGTVFAVAAAARVGLDAAGVIALVERWS